MKKGYYGTSSRQSNLRGGKQTGRGGKTVGAGQNKKGDSISSPPRKLPGSSAHDALTNSVHDFLLKNGHFKTLDIFQKEASSPSDYTTMQEFKHDSEGLGLTYLVSCLESGAMEKFFQAWNRFLPTSVLLSDQICHKLEFYINVYFAIYSLQPARGGIGLKKQPQDGQGMRPEMHAFKTFLDTKGSELCKAAEFLPFYALPYIPNPTEHPSFKHLFTKEWINELKAKVKSFLREHLTPKSVPVLYQMYAVYSKRADGGGGATPNKRAGGSGTPTPEVAAMTLIQEDFREKYNGMQLQCAELQRKEEYARSTLIESQTKWTSFAKEILNVAIDLVKAINNAKQGVPIQEKMLGIVVDKIHRYGNFLNVNLENLNPQNYSFEQEVEEISKENFHDSSISPIPQRPYSIASNPNFSQIDYNRVRETLYNSQIAEIKKCSLLQALRWRITRVRSTQARKQVLHYYIQYDILSCKEGKSPTKLHGLFQDMTKNGVEYLVRLINNIASECIGRTYLLMDDQIVSLLVTTLKGEHEDTSLRQNALGALQKFSLRRNPQSIMIDLDMIKWITDILKNEPDSLTDYTIEYATALLMNLSLRTSGKDKCEQDEVDIMKVLNDLIEHENLQVRTYINGTLYSVLTRPNLKEKAKAMGMEDILQYLMKTSDEQFKRQIQYILDQLNSEAQEEYFSDENEDDFDNDDSDDEDDDDFNEEEDMDDIIEEDDVLTGEDLLGKEFLADPELAKSQLHAVSSVILEDRKKTIDSINTSTIDPDRSKHDSSAILKRPITPYKGAVYGTTPDDRNLPSALKSRPKIPRTPMNESLRRKQGSAYGNQGGGVGVGMGIGSVGVGVGAGIVSNGGGVGNAYNYPYQNTFDTGSSGVNPIMGGNNGGNSTLTSQGSPNVKYHSYGGRDVSLQNQLYAGHLGHSDNFNLYDYYNSQEYQKRRKEAIDHFEHTKSPEKVTEEIVEEKKELQGTKELDYAFKTRANVPRTPPS